MYAKTHPQGYVKIKKLKADRYDHKAESLDRAQVVRFSNGQTRTIKHYKIRSGSLI